MSEPTSLSSLVSKRWDERQMTAPIPNAEALKEYAKKVSDVPVISHPGTKISDNKVTSIIMHRANILIRLSKKSAESKLIVDEHNQTQLRALKLYAMRDARFESEGFGMLNKGIVLLGYQGCGKTIMLKMLADAGPLDFTHDGSNLKNINDIKNHSWGDGVRFGLFHINNFHNCVQIEHDFRAKDGEQRIAALRSNKSAMVFDDLGFENDMVMNYGNRVNIMAEILNSRYNLFQDFGIPTFFTSNLVDADKIEKAYGIRNRSRLREMCNFIYFDIENHVDRRK